MLIYGVIGSKALVDDMTKNKENNEIYIPFNIISSSGFL